MNQLMLVSFCVVVAMSCLVAPISGRPNYEPNPEWHEQPRRNLAHNIIDTAGGVAGAAGNIAGQGVGHAVNLGAQGAKAAADAAADILSWFG